MKAVLLSINPEHVSNILDGTKRSEFRRSRCKFPIDLMVICCTAPRNRAYARRTDFLLRGR